MSLWLIGYIINCNPQTVVFPWEFDSLIFKPCSCWATLKNSVFVFEATAGSPTQLLLSEIPLSLHLSLPLPCVKLECTELYDLLHQTEMY